MANADNESVWRSSDKSDSVLSTNFDVDDTSYQEKCMIFFIFLNILILVFDNPSVLQYCQYDNKFYI